ncbi:NAD-dependent deacylase [Mesonia sediminis]|uniref:NAD-dependent protein deacylase n=1 Tax=Mesonia sediminis TaxID=1703946 RepID=A0ABW5SE31_9FLAO
MKKKLVVLSGAGISAESGIQTFRDANGLWENHDIMQVASPEGWEENPDLVLSFYNQRRRQLKKVQPNAAHLALKDLEKFYEVCIITQNVDDLHERAGSTSVIHLHGELLKARSCVNENEVLYWPNDLNIGDFCSQGKQLRPHIVWFGEAVPKLELAISKVTQADIIMIVGTSMQVYPAAGLVDYAAPKTPIHVIDLNPHTKPKGNIFVYPEKASLALPKLAKVLIKQA